MPTEHRIVVQTTSDLLIRWVFPEGIDSYCIWVRNNIGNIGKAVLGPKDFPVPEKGDVMEISLFDLPVMDEIKAGKYTLFILAQNSVTYQEVDMPIEFTQETAEKLNQNKKPEAPASLPPPPPLPKQYVEPAITTTTTLRVQVKTSKTKKFISKLVSFTTETLQRVRLMKKTDTAKPTVTSGKEPKVPGPAENKNPPASTDTSPLSTSFGTVLDEAKEEKKNAAQATATAHKPAAAAVATPQISREGHDLSVKIDRKAKSLEIVGEDAAGRTVFPLKEHPVGSQNPVEGTLKQLDPVSDIATGEVTIKMTAIDAAGNRSATATHQVVLTQKDVDQLVGKKTPAANNPPPPGSGKPAAAAIKTDTEPKVTELDKMLREMESSINGEVTKVGKMVMAGTTTVENRIAGSTKEILGSTTEIMGKLKELESKKPDPRVTHNPVVMQSAQPSWQQNLVTISVVVLGLAALGYAGVLGLMVFKTTGTTPAPVQPATPAAAVPAATSSPSMITTPQVIIIQEPEEKRNRRSPIPVIPLLPEQNSNDEQQQSRSQPKAKNQLMPFGVPTVTFPEATFTKDSEPEEQPRAEWVYDDSQSPALVAETGFASPLVMWEDPACDDYRGYDGYDSDSCFQSSGCSSGPSIGLFASFRVGGNQRSRGNGGNYNGGSGNGHQQPRNNRQPKANRQFWTNANDRQLGREAGRVGDDTGYQGAVWARGSSWLAPKPANDFNRLVRRARRN